MDVRALCLGVLSRGEASGYEIRKQFEEGMISHFQEAGFGSIYPALRRLSDDGLVECTKHSQDQRPDKKVYTITAEGRAALYDALMKPPAPDKYRSDFLFLSLFAPMLPASHIESMIEVRLAWFRAEIARMEGCVASDLSTGDRFVTEYGLAVYRAAAAFLEAHGHELVAESLITQPMVAE